MPRRKGKKSSKLEGRGMYVKNEFDEISDRMKEKNNGLYTETIRDVVILAAAVAAFNEKEPITFSTEPRVSTHKIPGSAIKSEHEFFFKVLSFWKTKDYNILIDSSKLCTLVEQYAAAGFKDLMKIFNENDIPNFQLIKLISED